MSRAILHTNTFAFQRRLIRHFARQRNEGG
ncbi:Uncharacterised protein [Vibrio cholerae]|nr:Uncharacterised protein [Vibrio cholerae]